MSGTKHDAGKPRMELLDSKALVEMAKVLGFGAEKYGDYNWKGGIKHSRLYGAVQRHLTSHWAGETLDPESGLPHLSHAMCGLMMMVGMPDEDDRHIKE